MDASAPKMLSDYRFFVGPMYNLTPNTRVVPYDLITPLFSDYAKKERFVWMPEGSKAFTTEDGSISFPQGTVLIKNFYFEADQDTKQIVETRLLVHRKNGWDPLTYIWDEGQTDAKLEIIGDVKNISASDDSGSAFTIDYAIPNKNQCKNCHEKDRNVVPLGPTVQNLNRNFAYESTTENQLTHWQNIGYLMVEDTAVLQQKMVAWDDPTALLHQRALAYLEVNCGTCHNPTGSAKVSGLHLTTTEENLYNLGVGKGPVSAGKGSGNNKYDIHPGQPDSSILVYRMESLDPGAMMPEIGRKLVHKEGVQLIREWIQNMETPVSQ